jgi:hypothetical protein
MSKAVRGRFDTDAMRPLRRAIRGLVQTARGGSAAHSDLRSRLIGIAAFTLMLDVAAGFAAFAFEHGEKQDRLHSVWEALFWTTTQLLTVSSQLPNPKSVGAHILDVGLVSCALSSSHNYGRVGHGQDRAPQSRAGAD